MTPGQFPVHGYGAERTENEVVQALTPSEESSNLFWGRWPLVQHCVGRLDDGDFRPHCGVAVSLGHGGVASPLSHQTRDGFGTATTHKRGIGDLSQISQPFLLQET